MTNTDLVFLGDSCGGSDVPQLCVPRRVLAYVLQSIHSHISSSAPSNVCFPRMHATIDPKCNGHWIVVSRAKKFDCKRRSSVASGTCSCHDFGKFILSMEVKDFETNMPQWEVLITHQGPYDSSQGVQLVVTALLAQIYGALSKNRVIRTTSQAFHALSFYWARQCASSSSDTLPYDASRLPSIDATSSEKEAAWRTWAAKEVQQRALLGHYLVDGLISRMSGETTSVRHTANQLGLPSSEIAFEARNADEWLNCMRSSEHTQLSFRKIISSLFLPEPQHMLQVFFTSDIRITILK